MAQNSRLGGGDLDINKRLYEITLDTKRGSKVPLINITEGDTNSVVFKITLTENGKKINIPSDSVVLLYFGKNDDTKTVQSTIDGSTYIVDGKILCEMKTNSIGTADSTRVEVKVLGANNGLLITPVQFAFHVTNSIVCNEDIESSNEYPVLIELIKKVEEMEGYVEQSFGLSEIIEVQNENTDNIMPIVSVFSSGFGDGGFGESKFGETPMVLERCKTTYKTPDKITIQPDNRFKGLIVQSVERVEKGQYVVSFEDSTTHLYISVQQEVK